MRKAILNIGHGNTINKKGVRVYDPGAVGNGFEEYKYNYDLVNKYVSPYLKEMEVDHEVIIQSERFSKLPAEINRISDKNDIIVSFHLNSVDYNEGNGVEVFHYPTSKEGKELAKIMLEANLKITRLKNRGIKPNILGARGHALFQKTKATAVLIESGFITNDRDIAILNAIQKELGKSYAEAIADYINRK